MLLPEDFTQAIFVRVKDTYVCPRCRALVDDRTQHAAFHNDLDDALGRLKNRLADLDALL
jgi:hypothetical protein